MTREKYQVSYSTVLATVSAIILTTLVFIFQNHLPIGSSPRQLKV